MPLSVLYLEHRSLVSATPFSTLHRNFHLPKSFHKPIFDILNRLDIDKKGYTIKASPFGDKHWKREPFLRKKARLFYIFLKYVFRWKRVCFLVFRIEKKQLKDEFATFSSSTLKNFLILELRNCPLILHLPLNYYFNLSTSACWKMFLCFFNFARWHIYFPKRFKDEWFWIDLCV